MRGILLFATLLAAVSAQAQTFEVEGNTYEVTGASTVELTKGDTKATTLVIPSTVTYDGKEYTVKSLGEGCFEWSAATSVTIPSTVDSIKRTAFYYGSLKEIKLSEGLKYIGPYAFGSNDCTELEIPASVEKIDEDAFFASTSLQKLTLHEGLKVIGHAAFYHPKALTQLILPSTVDSIGGSAFAVAESLADLQLNDGLKYIGEGAFQQSKKLTSLSLPTTVTYIGDEAFLKCTGLQTVITLPDNLQNYGGGAFAKTSVTGFSISDKNENFIVYDGCLYDSKKSLLYAVPMKGKTTLSLPSSVIGINSEAAWGSELTKVTLPKGLLAIADYTFEDCPITEINIPNTVTYIDEQAFANTKITKLTIPESVGYVGDGAFASCTSLTEATLPAGFPSIDYHLFNNDTQLSKITCLGTTAPTLPDIYEEYDNPFYGISSSAALYVPKGAKDSYTNKGWGDLFTSIKELEYGFFNPVSTDPKDSVAEGKYTSLSLSLYFDRTVSVVNEAPEVSIRKENILYKNVFTPDDSWKLNLNSDKRSVTLWASDYDGFTQTFDFDSNTEYFIVIPSGILKDNDGNFNNRIVLHINNPEATGIHSVATNHSARTNAEVHYNLSGQQVNRSYRGVQIVKYPDGSTKKILSK